MNHNQASILEPEEIAQVLNTDLATGLTSFEARDRNKKYGFNKLEDASASKTVRRLILTNVLNYLKQFLNPLIQLLILCALVSLVIGEFENAISVLIAIVLVCTISFTQERRANKSLEKLNKQLPNMCKVIRENQTHELEAHYLVPGDIIYLSEGQRVPADVRLYDLHSLILNEANLTGETNSQPKINAVSSKKLASILNGNNLESLEDNKMFIYQNLALMGTTVEAGHSRGIVISTGKATRYGQVYCMLKNTIQPRSPLQNNIDQLSLHLVIIACFVIAIMSIIGIVQQRQILDVAYYAISLAITAIPEGLPVVVAVIMALGVLRLSKQKTIVKSLNSIETLGCIQVLCADKTGTLTRNDMTLTDIVTSELYSLSSDELQELNNDECKKHMTFNKFGGKLYSIGRLMEVGTLCNNASFDPTKSGSGRFVGQATECAILDASIQMGFGDSRTKFDRISEQPFKASSRRMVVQCQRLDLPGNSPMYYVKGAWEEILEDCTHYYECGLIKPRSEEMWLEYKRVCSTLGLQGLRVLAMATGPSMEQLTFVGMVGINNALRENMVETVNKLKNEFCVDVKMITGDSKETAVAIGKSLGLIEPSLSDIELEELIMSGGQVHELLSLVRDDEEEFDGRVLNEILRRSVFYRVDPVQKANIVEKLQEFDKIVAMTGDGINDVISLKKANLSLVMGSGADVCKEIADVIVVDNDLSVLIAAIVEGKGIHYKLQSFMSYQISISLTLVLLVSISFGCRIEVPFTVIQLLFINILTDGPPAQSLGVEKVEVKELNLKPRNVHKPLLNFSLLRTLTILTFALFLVNGSLYYTLLESGKLDVEARSMLFTCFVFSSIFAAISLRSKMKTIFETNAFGNKELFCCSVIVIIVQAAILNIRILSETFEVEPLTVSEFVLLFLYAATVLVIMDVVKVILRLFEYGMRHIRKKSNEDSKDVDVIKKDCS